MDSHSKPHRVQEFATRRSEGLRSKNLCPEPFKSLGKKSQQRSREGSGALQNAAESKTQLRRDRGDGAQIHSPRHAGGPQMVSGKAKPVEKGKKPVRSSSFAGCIAREGGLLVLPSGVRRSMAGAAAEAEKRPSVDGEVTAMFSV